MVGGLWRDVTVRTHTYLFINITHTDPHKRARTNRNTHITVTHMNIYAVSNSVCAFDTEVHPLVTGSFMNISTREANDHSSDMTPTTSRSPASLLYLPLPSISPLACRQPVVYVVSLKCAMHVQLQNVKFPNSPK